MRAIDDAWALMEMVLPPTWVFQLNIWRAEDWEPGEQWARYTASAGPNEGPEEAWLVGKGERPADALNALRVLLATRTATRPS